MILRGCLVCTVDLPVVAVRLRLRVLRTIYCVALRTRFTVVVPRVADYRFTFTLVIPTLVGYGYVTGYVIAAFTVVVARLRCTLHLITICYVDCSPLRLRFTFVDYAFCCCVYVVPRCVVVYVTFTHVYVVVVTRCVVVVALLR